MKRIITIILLCFASIFFSMGLYGCLQCKHVFTDYVSDNNATCLQDGTKTALCENNCGEKHTILEENSKLDHSFVNYASDNNATCFQDGTKTALCENSCGEKHTIIEENSKLIHTFIDYVSDNNATCYNNGTKTAICEYGCGTTDTIEDEESKLPHSFTNYISDNNATYDNDGTKTAICDNENCDEIHVVIDEGSKLESNISYEFNIINEYALVQLSNSTTEYDFSLAITCVGNYAFFISKDSLGADVVDKNIKDLKLGENVFFVNVTLKGNVKETIKVVLYRKNIFKVNFSGLNTLQDVEEGSFATNPVTQPVRIGYSFSGWNFDFDTPITENITIQPTWTINQYTILLRLNNGEPDVTITQNYDTEIPDVVEPIRPGYTFAGWSKSIPKTMPAEDVIITAEWMAIFFVYQNNISGLTDYGKTISNIVIPEKIDGADILGIYSSTFTKNKVLRSVTLSDSIIHLGDNAFSELPSLKTIIIGKGLETIGEFPIYKCNALTEIIVAEENQYFKSVDNNFYDKDVKTLINYCSGKPETIFVIPDTVTKIDDLAIINAQSLEYITIPNSVERIGKDNFSGCDALSYNRLGNYYYLGNGENEYLYLAKTDLNDSNSISIYTDCKFIGEGVFDDFESLESVTLPNNLLGIGNSAFYSCIGIKSIDIPDSVLEIGDSAFAYCTNLEEVNISENSNIDFIGGSAFYSCFSLKNFDVPKKVTYISEYAFSVCSKLEHVSLPNDLICVKNFAFADCVNLREIVIPESVTEIGRFAFGYCDSLTNVSISKNVTLIDYRAFTACKNLINIDVDVNNENYKSIDGNLYTKDGKILIQYAIAKELTTFVVPEHVESIEEFSFTKCVSIQKIVLNESVKNIAGAFDSCFALNEIFIPKNVESIHLAFRYCDNLTKIEVDVENPYFKSVNGCLYTKDGETLLRYGFATPEESFVVPDEVKEIAWCSSFCVNPSLKLIYIPDTVDRIGNYAFEGNENVVIHCEAKEKPDTWESDWNQGCIVFWGMKID